MQRQRVKCDIDCGWEGRVFDMKGINSIVNCANCVPNTDASMFMWSTGRFEAYMLK